MTTRTIETRAVLAGAYLNRDPQRMLRHVVRVDADGVAYAVLCDRVDLDSLADRFAGDPDAAPTCPTCLRRLLTIYREQTTTKGIGR
jgi:hypothetical protein